MTDRSEQRTLLTEAIAPQLRDMETSGLLRSECERVERGEWPAQSWAQLEACGLTSLLVPENEGGFGGGWEEAGIALSLIGFHGVPLPIPETIVARFLLSRAGIDAPSGSLAIAFAQQATLRKRATRPGRLTAAAAAVLWGGMVEHVVVVRYERRACHIVLLHRSAFEPASCRNSIGREPIVDLRCRDAEIIAAGKLACDPFELGALTRVALMAGAANSVLQQSVQYANDRHQFGRPIGKFQVIQHALASLASEAAAMHCAAIAACRAADLGDAHFEIAAAKLRANRAVSTVTSIAHQVHGAIGFSSECRLHFATQRLWAWRSDYGNDRYWAAKLGDATLRHGSDRFWAHLTSLTDTQRQH